MAVGDGTTPIIDLPKYTCAVRDVIKNKINAYLGTEYLSLSSEQKNNDIGTVAGSHLCDGLTIENAPETLILSREL